MSVAKTIVAALLALVLAVILALALLVRSSLPETTEPTPTNGPMSEAPGQPVR